LSPKHESSEKRRQQILEAAMSCFGKKGYYNTSMQDIVAASGLSKGAIYWYFKSKKEIFLELMDIWEIDFSHRMKDILASGPSAVEILKNLGRMIFREAKDRPEFIHTLAEFWSHSVHDAEVAARMRAYYADWMVFFEQLVQDGIARGEIPPQDSKALTVLFGSIVEGTFVLYIVNPDLVDPERNWLLAVDLIARKGTATGDKQ